MGRITSPADGAFTGRVVEIKGFTRRLPLDRQYLWVAVDIPSINRCWPKRHIETFNAPFTTKIDEQGPNRIFTVFLYALDREYHQRILEWQKDCLVTKTVTGLRMLPGAFRLNSCTLVFGKG